MSQPITNLPVGSYIKMTETYQGVSVPRPWIITAQSSENPYGDDKVLCERKNAERYTHIDGRWNTSNTAIKYADSIIHNTLNNQWLALFSTDTLNVIATSTVICQSIFENEAYTIASKFFIPSPHDEGAEISGFVDPSTKITYKVPHNVNWSDDGTSLKPSNNNNTPWYYVRNTPTQSRPRGFKDNEYGTWTYSDFNRDIPLRPCCNIYATALVSDEPDEDGYYALIPDPDNPYIYVRFHCSLGTVDDMPLKVRVDLTTECNPEITSLQVCNNYGDASPTWETMTVGEKHTFTNTTKTADNWEIGVKVEARGENTIRVYEPFAIVQTEVEE